MLFWPMVPRAQQAADVPFEIAPPIRRETVTFSMALLFVGKIAEPTIDGSGGCVLTPPCGEASRFDRRRDHHVRPDGSVDKGDPRLPTQTLTFVPPRSSARRSRRSIRNRRRQCASSPYRSFSQPHYAEVATLSSTPITADAGQNMGQIFLAHGPRTPFGGGSGG
jgi:hypothetical protein